MGSFLKWRFHYMVIWPIATTPHALLHVVSHEGHKLLCGMHPALLVDASGVIAYSLNTKGHLVGYCLSAHPAQNAFKHISLSRREPAPCD